MNRIIKFRAWDGEQMRDIFSVSSFGEIIMGGEEYPDWTLMQFTGLLDKNGKEIYEGDIIFSDNHFGCITGGDLFPSMRKVSFDDREAKFELRFIATEDYAKAFNPSGQYLCKPNCEGSFEIIGNIYENPELLPS